MKRFFSRHNILLVVVIISTLFTVYIAINTFFPNRKAMLEKSLTAVERTAERVRSNTDKISSNLNLIYKNIEKIIALGINISTLLMYARELRKRRRARAK